MGYTKRQFVEASFEEIGVAGHVFDSSSSEFQSALRRLDSMMAEWNAKGIRIGYLLPTTPEESDIDSESGVPDSANEAIILNLTIRIGPSFGKAVSFETKSSARRAYSTLLALNSIPGERDVTAGMPRGAGHKTFNNNNFFPGALNTDPAKFNPI